MAAAVPTTLGALADIPVGEHDNSSLRVVATGASIARSRSSGAFLARWGGDCVQQVYGMTELAGAYARLRRREAARGGRRHHNRWSSLRSSRRQGAHRPWPSPVGELLTRGPQVFRGLCRQEQNRGGLPRGWLRTGDICASMPMVRRHHGPRQGRHHPRGHNIDPRTIEDAALEFPAWHSPPASAGRHYAGEVPMLFVSAQPGVSIDPQALAPSCRRESWSRRRNRARFRSSPKCRSRRSARFFKPKLREIAAGDAARELLAAEGLSKDVQCRGDHRSLARPLSARHGSAGSGRSGQAAPAAFSREVEMQV